jgi:type I restriction enzyme M protein
LKGLPQIFIDLATATRRNHDISKRIEDVTGHSRPGLFPPVSPLNDQSVPSWTTGCSLVKSEARSTRSERLLSGGVSNPLSVIEQITYLLFIKRLDELQTLEESKAQAFDKPLARLIFPEGNDPKGRPYDDLRWSGFGNLEAREMMEVVDEHVFPFLGSLGEERSSYGRHMRDARLGFSNANLLAKVVAQLDGIEMGDRDTKGDVYEYVLGKIASGAAERPVPDAAAHHQADGRADRADARGRDLRPGRRHLRLPRGGRGVPPEGAPGPVPERPAAEPLPPRHVPWLDFDATMLRIGAMNMTLHGVEDPEIAYRDSVAEDHAEDAGAYSLVLANPPFAGSLDYETTAKDLLKIVKTKKTELLFVALFHLPDDDEADRGNAGRRPPLRARAFRPRHHRRGAPIGLRQVPGRSSSISTACSSG